MTYRKFFMLCLLLVLLLGMGVFFVMVLAQACVGRAERFIVPKTDAPQATVAIVLGASVKQSGEPSDILEDRLLTAHDLYNRGKVKKILVSGDNGTESYDEVNAMRRYLLDQGVPEQDIFLDHAGFDTYDSLYRAKNIFLVDDALIVTQAYHLPRALFIGRSLDMDVHGVVADRQEYQKIRTFRAREVLANVKALANVVLGAKAAYLGEVIPITGDGRSTWDEFDRN